MRAVVLGAVLVLAGCASAPKSAAIGMDVDTYKQACAGVSVLDEWYGRTFGECAMLPTEYAEFRGGKIVGVLNSSQWAEALMDALDCTPAERVDRCGDTVRQFIAEREAAKLAAKRAREERNQARFFEGMSTLGAAMQGIPSSPDVQTPTYQSAPASSGLLCTKKREERSVRHKTCYYNCAGSERALTVQATTACPLTVND
jgi:outer membrane murein-binding lipoprotein Lpp